MTPLEAMTKQICAISRSGHSDGRRIHLNSPPRELAELADGFNEMLDALEHHRDQIARREARFRALIEDCPDILAVMGRDGKVTFVNPSRFSDIGAPNTPTTLLAEDLLHPDDHARGRAAVREVLKHPERIARLDGRARGPDGIYRHYETILHNRLGDPDIGGIVLSTRDVTERREAETAVRVEEQRLLVALDCAQLVVFNQDRELRYTWNFNSHFFADPAFIIGKTDEELFSPELAARLTTFKRGILESGQGDRTEIHFNEQGHNHWCLLCAQPLRDRNDNIVGLVGAALETTEQHRTETLLRHAQRLESLGLLTGGIAHDFNNYLGIISANLECILPALDKASSLYRYGENALTAARQGADLTRNLLAFARQQPLRPSRLDLNALLKDFGSILRHITGPAIALDCDLDPDLWPCEADPGELQNALVNLAINACDAMPEGGTLTIRTRNRHMAGAENGRNGYSVQLSVTDTGHGMPLDVLEHAFDPFFTTKPARDGTGLGLSMVYGFARQSGGQVDIDSVVGRGTTVEIRLPAFYPAGTEAKRPARHPQD
jgi:PAS domain S-box-containing protein